MGWRVGLLKGRVRPMAGHVHLTAVRGDSTLVGAHLSVVDADLLAVGADLSAVEGDPTSVAFA